MNFEDLISSDKVEIRPYQKAVVMECYNRFMGIHKDRAGNMVAPHKTILVESPTGC